MAHPIWMDGPLEGQDHEVSDEVIEQGMYHYRPDVVYTFSQAMVVHRRVTVASCAGRIPSLESLFTLLASPAAQRAAV